MATMVQKPVSNIAAAFAAQQASQQIPIAHDGAYPASADTLLTPPSSLSPTLSAHKRRQALPLAGRVATPEAMDFDLEDAVEHARAQDQPSALSKEALAGLDATRQITAAMLAKHHLPAIIAGHGAMPIRDMMAHLTHSVPGFSGLAPAKARRLVVAALEHRAGGGMHGEVKFEKVGWGRWSVAGSSQARGLPIGSLHGASGATPPASIDSMASGLQIPKLRQQERDTYQGSWNAGSWSPPHKMGGDEDMADGMSLDGSDDSLESDSASDMDLGEDLDDDTDQEDWAAMGPQITRETRRGPRREHRDYNYLSRTQSSNPRYRSISTQGHSLPQGAYQGSYSRTPVLGSTPIPSLKFTASPAVTGSGAERDAIEALLSMGSMPRA